MASKALICQELWRKTLYGSDSDTINLINFIKESSYYFERIKYKKVNAQVVSDDDFKQELSISVLNALNCYNEEKGLFYYYCRTVIQNAFKSLVRESFGIPYKRGFAKNSMKKEMIFNDNVIAFANVKSVDMDMDEIFESEFEPIDFLTLPVEDIVENRITIAQIKKLILEMPNEAKEIFFLRYGFGRNVPLSVKEICEVQNTKTSHVYFTLCKGIKEIQKKVS